MTEFSQALPTAGRDGHLHGEAVFLRSLIIAITAFLSLVDLFATQAILPSLTSRYGVTPGAMARLQCEHLWHARVGACGRLFLQRY